MSEGKDIAALVLQMHDIGGDASTIAAVFGVSTRTMQRWLASAGRGRLSEDDRLRVIQYVHDRRHEGMSVRQIVADLAEKVDQGAPPKLRRSVGWVATVLREYRCATCSSTPRGASEHVPRAESDVQNRHMARVNGGSS